MASVSKQIQNADEAISRNIESLAGQRVTEVRLFAGSRMARAALPQPGMGLSRHK